MYLICLGVLVLFVGLCEYTEAKIKYSKWKGEVLKGLTPEKIFSMPKKYKPYMAPPKKY